MYVYSVLSRALWKQKTGILLGWDLNTWPVNIYAITIIISFWNNVIRLNVIKPVSTKCAKLRIVLLSRNMLPTKITLSLQYCGWCEFLIYMYRIHVVCEFSLMYANLIPVYLVYGNMWVSTCCVDYILLKTCLVFNFYCCGVGFFGIRETSQFSKEPSRYTQTKLLDHAMPQNPHNLIAVKEGWLPV